MRAGRSLVVLCASLGAIACGEPPRSESPIVDVPSALPAPSVRPAVPDAPVGARLVPETSTVTFLMTAPLESQRASFTGEAVQGSVDFDRATLERAKGHVSIDLERMRLEQKIADREDGWIVNEKQNEHARAWLEIDDTTPLPLRTANRVAQFNLNGLDVLREEGKDTVRADIRGSLLFHSHKRDQNVQVLLRFSEGGRVHLETVEPMKVALADFDIGPRSSFGERLPKTLEMLAPKVAPVAEVSLSLDFVREAASP